VADTDDQLGGGLVCGMPKVYVGDDPRDHNPVVRVEIQNSEIGVPWQIRHILANGQIINRGDQYNVRDWSDTHKSQWSGLLYKNKNLFMVGEVKQNEAGQIFYQERLYDQGKNNLLVMDMAAQCREVGEPSPPPPTRSEVPAIPPAIPPAAPAAPAAVARRDSVPIYPSDSARPMLDVIVGGQPARMLLDTGSDVTSVTEAVAGNILRSGGGRMSEPSKFVMADGSEKVQPVMLIYEMRVGSHVVKDVMASVSNSTMLLGFHVVNGIGPFTIDTRKQELSWNKE
jgi:hypothetical protein